MSMPSRIDVRAWQASTVGHPDSWYFTPPRSCLAALDLAIQQFRQHPQPVTSLQANAGPCAGRGEDLRPAVDLLEGGPGFVILRGLPLERYSADDLQAAYWLLGQLLGRPMTQNVQGTLLYDVRDTGQDVRYGARFSVTNAESTFHTDNSFGDEVLDYVGLLCLKTARSGGLSQMVNGYAVHDRLRERHPDLLPVLEQPFHVDRRGGLRPGDEPTARYPIFDWHGDALLCRYLRYWIEVGHEKVQQPLTARQIEALDTLDAVMTDRSLQLEFPLQPGDMYFINNRWILHNRTGFEDHAELELKRHLVRLWLQAR